MPPVWSFASSTATARRPAFACATARTSCGTCSSRASALDAFPAHLDEACVGSVSEIFDAEPPYTPRGCIAQAWSVAEVLRLRARLPLLDDE
jgi:glycogen debranching enzyme